MEVIEALRGRASTRAFLDREVQQSTLEQLLEAARWAPSGVNIQPWQVAVVQGATKARLEEALIAAREAGQPENPDYSYYPNEWFDPYKERRKQCGIALYRAQGIGRDDVEGRKRSWYANYRFFDAPVGLLFFIDRRLGQGAWVDMGIFLQSVMLAARGFGLDTCPQASLAEFPDIVRDTLGVDPEMAVVCGMALGYADPAAPVNDYRTEREPVEAFTRWFD